MAWCCTPARTDTSLAPRRICIVYDCLYPWTVGGAERWLRSLAEALAAEGHDVTYLTRRQWVDASPPRLPGVRVLAVSPEAQLYGPTGNRTITEPIRFGLGVFLHLISRRRRYDVVHVGAFPYFSLLAAAIALKGTRTQLVTEWYEVWSHEYWVSYLGPLKGRIGWTIQRLCARLRQNAFVLSELHARRLRQLGLPGQPTRLAGLYAGRSTAGHAVEAMPSPLVVFAGRHIREKQVTAIPPAIAAARARVPQLRATILGNGPESERLRRAIHDARVEDAIDLPGFVSPDEVHEALARATCLLLPSTREGYGLIVVEAAAVGTPSIVVAGVDNAAVELIQNGVNGFVAPSAAPEALADAIIRIYEGGYALRQSTADWFTRHAHELSVQTSLQRVLATYASDIR